MEEILADAAGEYGEREDQDCLHIMLQYSSIAEQYIRSPILLVYVRQRTDPFPCNGYIEYQEGKYEKAHTLRCGRFNRFFGTQSDFAEERNHRRLGK